MALPTREIVQGTSFSVHISDLRDRNGNQVPSGAAGLTCKYAIASKTGTTHVVNTVSITGYDIDTGVVIQCLSIADTDGLTASSDTDTHGIHISDGTDASYIFREDVDVIEDLLT